MNIGTVCVIGVRLSLFGVHLFGIRYSREYPTAEHRIINVEVWMEEEKISSLQRNLLSLLAKSQQPTANG